MCPHIMYILFGSQHVLRFIGCCWKINPLNWASVTETIDLFDIVVCWQKKIYISIYVSEHNINIYKDKSQIQDFPLLLMIVLFLKLIVW